MRRAQTVFMWWAGIALVICMVIVSAKLGIALAYLLAEILS